ncbi:MAG: Xaa-Pro peptidase family protein [DPANN group archaeon]|nr:Xaa-Pro peptidase family protein [DPANN group archaeon]
MGHIERIQKLRDLMNEKNLDAILIPSFDHSSPNLYYFTEYDDCGPNFYIVTPDDEMLLTWECIKAKKESAVKNCTTILNTTISDYLKQRTLEKKVIGIDGNIRYSFVEQLKLKLPHLKIKDIKHNLMEIRAIKEPQEIENIRSACLLSDRILKEVREGRFPQNELLLKQEIQKTIVNTSAEWSFNTLVAGDENSANIHHIPKNNHFKNIVLIDFGIKNNRYTSDVTRTFILKKDEKIQRAMNTLITLHNRLDDIMEPDIRASDIALFASNHLEMAGYKDTSYSNVHSLGHGVGLDGHEYPIISEKSTHRLEKDMVFTLEPAIYFPGEFGIRLEDTVLMKGTGIKRLSQFSFE